VAILERGQGLHGRRRRLGLGLLAAVARPEQQRGGDDDPDHGRIVPGPPRGDTMCAMAERTIEIEGLRLTAPTDVVQNPDPLSERRLAYWARIWPGGIVLARFIAAELAPRLEGRRVVELGCGLGAPSVAAARAGAEVTATDGESAALDYARRNARQNGVSIDARRLEWDRVPEELVGRFDLVIGAELIYDRAQIAPLAGAIDALLAPGGESWIADPSRLGIATMLDAAAAAGLAATHVRTEPHPDDVPPADGGEPMPVHIYRLAR
jgi:predicted nicotinamide N-methyase